MTTGQAGGFAKPYQGMIPAALTRSASPAHAPIPPDARCSRLVYLHWLLSMRFLYLPEKGFDVFIHGDKFSGNPAPSGGHVQSQPPVKRVVCTRAKSPMVTGQRLKALAFTCSSLLPLPLLPPLKGRSYSLLPLKGSSYSRTLSLSIAMPCLS